MWIGEWKFDHKFNVYVEIFSSRKFLPILPHALIGILLTFCPMMCRGYGDLYQFIPLISSQYKGSWHGLGEIFVQ